MREIKFRAWDKNGDGMFYNIQYGIEFDDNSNYIFDNFLKPLPRDIHEWNIMQYTALKDKNGKEIYEGDIVSGAVYYGWENEKGLGIVKFGEWEQDGSGHEYSTETCLGWFVDIKESEFYKEPSHLFSEKAKFLEVIGNIYENPELLNAQEK